MAKFPSKFLKEFLQGNKANKINVRIMIFFPKYIGNFVAPALVKEEKLRLRVQ